MKRAITIEKLLTWAYREELAKRDFIETLGIGNSLKMGSMLGTHVSSGPPQYYAELVGAGIHDDALTVEQAVKDLAGIKLVVPLPSILLSDFPDMKTDAAVAMSGYRLQLDGLVARMAQLSEAPDWRVEPQDVPKRRVVTHPSSGAPLWFIKRKVRLRAGTERWFEDREDDGYDHTGKRALPGAYRKYWWDPDPRGIVDRRFDWLAWRLALDAIGESISTHLKAFLLDDAKKVSLPWSSSLAFDAWLERPKLVSQKLGIAPQAAAAGERAALRLQQGQKKVLTAAGT